MFVYDTPVYGSALFVGRELTLRSLFDGVLKGRSFALCGGPKIGKSSILLQLQLRLRERWVREPKASRIVPVYVDVAAILRDASAGKNQALTPEMSAVFLARELWAAFSQSVLDARARGNSPAPRVPTPKFLLNRSPWDVFFEACAELIQELSGTPGWSFYVYILDNCEVLIERGREDVVQALAQLFFGRLPFSPYGVVMAGGRFLREALLDRHSPFKPLRPLLLADLNHSEARALVRLGLQDAPDDLSEELIRISGRHPYIMQRLLAELVQMGNSFDFESAVGNAATDLEDYYERAWQELALHRNVIYRGAYAAPEHALMQVLIDQNDALAINTAEENTGIKPLREYAEMLEYLGLIERKLTQNEQRFRAHFALWNYWYAQRVMR